MTAWLDIAEAIADDIRTGRTPIGTAVPSTAQLVATYGASQSTVRRAINQLKAAGILDGEPGKAVRVRAVPAPGVVVMTDAQKLAAEVADLRARVEGIERRLGPPAP